MGVFSGMSSSSYDNQRDCNKEPYIGPLPNPDPNNYEILSSEKIGTLLLVKIHYVGCTNFEGNKILVYENCTIDDLKIQGHLDPHFSESQEFYSPIARFEPTKKGWKLAKILAKTLDGDIYINK